MQNTPLSSTIPLEKQRGEIAADKYAHCAFESGRDGALRRPRRRAQRQATEPKATIGPSCYIRSTLVDSGGDIAARCPYQSQVHGQAASLIGCSVLNDRCRTNAVKTQTLQSHFNR
jgi:hypothetical protein